jgi:hypothetical protein
MMSEMVAETSAIFSQLTQLTPRDLSRRDASALAGDKQGE